MNSALWIIPLMPLVIGFFTTWSFREAITEAVWFNVAWVSALGVIYVLELAGATWVSTSPTGMGGFFALLIGFAALGIRRYQYKKEKARKAEARRLAAEEAARKARIAARSGRPGRQQPEEKSLIVDAFRFAAKVKKNSANARRSAGSK